MDRQILNYHRRQKAEKEQKELCQSIIQILPKNYFIKMRNIGSFVSFNIYRKRFPLSKEIFWFSWEDKDIIFEEENEEIFEIARNVEKTFRKTKEQILLELTFNPSNRVP